MTVPHRFEGKVAVGDIKPVSLDKLRGELGSRIEYRAHDWRSARVEPFRAQLLAPK